MFRKRRLPRYCAAALVATLPALLHAGPAVTVQTSKGVFAFVPTACAIYQEGDMDDIEVHGPGIAPDGEPAFFEFSSTAQSMEIRLGTDSLFASSDNVLLSQGELHVLVDGSIVRIDDIILTDQSQQPVDAGVSLEIDCRAN